MTLTRVPVWIEVATDNEDEAYATVIEALKSLTPFPGIMNALVADPDVFPYIKVIEP